MKVVEALQPRHREQPAPVCATPFRDADTMFVPHDSGSLPHLELCSRLGANPLLDSAELEAEVGPIYDLCSIDA
jgi:hypothetical protein